MRWCGGAHRRQFRRDALGGTGTDDELPEKWARERWGTFKHADLYKMHTYREAIPRARSVCILFSDAELRHFAVAGELIATLAGLPPVLAVVGAVPHAPASTSDSTLRAVLMRLVKPPRRGIGRIRETAEPRVAALLG